ncbi:hypothetical protein PVAND_003529 [Polypedilum vanderplanki]|uniref:Lipase domain-containing protein n=1 Tax=Polypedilum vanderplanki TaxID=319348 RepID=A0A9J6BVD4_POLVA|nr:hypothetical protein PVAND_003529 [Polypedilum vanderplanki]
MKLFLVLLIVGLTEVFPSPLNTKSDEARWTIARDGEGKMHLVDLYPVDAETEPAFNPEFDMFFLLFTRSNPTEGQRITWSAESIGQSNFRRGAQTRILIHGWTTSSEATENIFTTRDFLTFGDYNVIVVDWSVGASANYITSRNRVGQAGEIVARLIDFLHQNNYVDLSNINLIGHSLGSHVAGFTGKNVQSGKVNAIFGTDPAGPLFNINNPSNRLDVDDAIYTEAIHTNAGTLGFDEPITHASFYPNFGRSQPGCGNDIGGSCAHARGPLFYAESINSNRFVARQCANYNEIASQNCPGTGTTAIMGGDSAKSIRGVFFLTTNSESPFAQG